MPKAPFSGTPEQRKLLATVKRLHQKKADVDGEYKRALADAAAAGIPVKTIAEEIDVERKTVYRHLGRSMT